MYPFVALVDDAKTSGPQHNYLPVCLSMCVSNFKNKMCVLKYNTQDESPPKTININKFMRPFVFC